MADVTLIHTADLDDATLDEAHGMTLEAFATEFTDDDWEHGLGGLHAIARDGDTIIGHAAIVQRHLLYQRRALRAGYIEAVAVHVDHRRGGVGGQLLEALEPIAGRAFDLGVLSATDVGMPFYRSRGWEPWRGTLHAFTPEGIIDQPEEEGSLLVFGVQGRVAGQSVALDLDAELTCDWRNGDLW